MNQPHQPQPQQPEQTRSTWLVIGLMLLFVLFGSYTSLHPTHNEFFDNPKYGTDGWLGGWLNSVRSGETAKKS